MMHGRFKDPLGNTLVQDGYQIRMAAKTVLRAGLDVLPLLDDQTQDRPEIIITEIRVNDPGGGDPGEEPKK
jgi:hypothetical protein